MNSKAARAIDVAAYILRRKSSMTTWELQKLVYYCQAWQLALAGEPLFLDRIEAWKDGPVVKSLFHDHSGKRHVDADAFGGDPAALCEEHRTLVDRVSDAYRDLTPQDLRELTHQEDPWVHARGGLPPEAHGDEEITRDAMRSYYSTLPSPEIVAVNYSVTKRYSRTLRRLAE